jgi:hypothetical protein
MFNIFMNAIFRLAAAAAVCAYTYDDVQASPFNPLNPPPKIIIFF